MDLCLLFASAQRRYLAIIMFTTACSTPHPRLLMHRLVDHLNEEDLLACLDQLPHGHVHALMHRLARTLVPPANAALPSSSDSPTAADEANTVAASSSSSDSSSSFATGLEAVFALIDLMCAKAAEKLQAMGGLLSLFVSSLMIKACSTFVLICIPIRIVPVTLFFHAHSFIRRHHIAIASSGIATQWTWFIAISCCLGPAGSCLTNGHGNVSLFGSCLC